MRVALIGGGVQPIPPPGYGGVERTLSELAAALTAAGHEAVIINRVRHRRTRDEYPFAWELPRLLRGERYDVLHAHTPVVANRLAGRKLRYVYTSHSRHWYYREKLSHRWGYWLERRAVRRAAAVIALTQPFSETMRAAVRPPLPPMRVVPIGVDTARFVPRWELRTGRRALGVGVVAPFKRWHLAAEALRGSGVELVIVGPIASPGYAAEVRGGGEKVALLGEVSQEELERRFAESDYLVHPSSVEILSGTVLGGLSAGLPVLGGAAVRGIVDEGGTGWSLPDDPAALVTGMRERIRGLLDHEEVRRTMGEAARQSAETRYSWPHVAAAHLEVYRTVAEEEASAAGPEAVRR